MRRVIYILTLFSMLSMGLSPVFASNSAIVGTWYSHNPGREWVYYKFTEDNKCSKWSVYSTFESGELVTSPSFTDVPYSYDEENMIITVQEKEDFSWNWELESIDADRFIVKGDLLTYYRDKTFSMENQDGVTLYYSWISDDECEVINGGSPYVGEISIPQTVEYEGVERRVSGIGNDAFSGCEGVTKVVLPEGLSRIGSNAFYGCQGLEEIVLPEGVATVEEGAFELCYSLKNVVLPNSITFLGPKALRTCAFESIVLPNNLTGIEMGVFEGCKNLASIVIPEGVTYIDSYAFMNCSALKAVYVGATPPDCSRCDRSPFNYISKECTLYVPTGASSSYQRADWWKDFQYIVEYDPSSIKNIALKHSESVYNLNGSRMVHDEKTNNMYIQDGKKYLNKK